ncbi:hypothetical protein ACFYNO_00060 [Kitasatospora sp. NPDC006697]|uniref:hypothetical protein n=1 Tax=Kitasatospora sp. NPDC006697 TaxID=3364020 RepID=UPI0036A614F6
MTDSALRIDYDGRRFRPVSEDPEEAGRSARYHQQGDLLWGEFAGGDTRRGVLTGVCSADGVLDFAYCMVLGSGEVVSGRCHSEPSTLPDGRILLREWWERYGRDGDSGISYLEEVPAPATAPASEA